MVICEGMIACASYVAPILPSVASTVGGWIGFGAGGPIAGTAAAGIQAGIGNVAAGSAFAVVQQAAMTTAAISFSSVLFTGALAAGGYYGVRKYFGV
ncbi:hypothetical protein LSTR_LSTR000613 [Laodelphax striatellus]|uniref:Uncharacterized protein n=1 Tax=Laodelphax striatellus TaxID=195883 RepID=A0A482XH55_LAOST|nr:hypothetical protein LSTR_LSTR000613 [Laodelphax striatellus]